MKIPVFLDRDGVINVEPSRFGKDYVTCREDFHFLDGTLDALRLLFNNNYDIYIISNQSGINKGIFSRKELTEVSDFMLTSMHDSGIKIKGLKYCQHVSEENCSCKKPRSRYVEEILAHYKFKNKRKIFFLGDQEVDIKTAFNYKINSILVLSGKSNFSTMAEFDISPGYVAKDLYDAVKNIILL